MPRKFLSKKIIYLLFLTCISSCKSQDHNDLKSQNYTISWNQYLGNTKTAYYKDLFIPSDNLDIIEITTEKGGLPCPLIISDDVVYFGTAQSSIHDNPISYIYAFNENKTLKWKKEIKGNIVHSMAVSKGVLVVTPTSNDYVYGLNTKNGDILWRTKNPFPQKIESTAPIIDDNLVYINVIFILDLETGLPVNDNYSKWHTWSTFNYPEFRNSSLFTSYSVLSEEGIVSLEKGTGKQKWYINGGYKLINKTFSYKDTLYVGQRYYGLGKIPLNNPKLLEDDWYDVKTNKAYGIKVDNLYYYTKNSSYSSEVIAMNLDTKKIVWKHHMNSDRITEPIIIGDYIYFGTSDGILYAINRTTGKIKIKKDLNGRIVGRLAYASEKLYVSVIGWRFSDEFKIYLIKNK